ncbi:MAG TPA: carbon storage regulator [Ktedonobacterales bacterium]
MLVLRRKAGEAIVLDERVTVYVLEVEGNRVKLGIIAPPGVSVVRQELVTGTPVVGQVAETQKQTAPGGSSSQIDARLHPVRGAR